ncbi:MAG: hypothetical protein AB1792_06455 [Candidatus Zixiibacteriota bacterium]
MPWWLIVGFPGLLATALMLLAPIRLQLVLESGQWRVRISYIGLQVAWRQGVGRAEVRFLGLRLWSSVGVFDIKSTGAVPPRAGAAPDSAASSRPGSRPGARIPRLWEYRSVLRRAAIVLARLLGRLWRCWRLERGRVFVSVRAANPALTGWASGVFWAMQPAIRKRWPVLDVNGSFDFAPRASSELAVESDLMYRGLPLMVVWAVGRAAVTMPWRDVIRMKRAWAR